MKNSSIALSILLCSVSILSALHLEVQELNFQNKQELAEICSVFNNNKSNNEIVAFLKGHNNKHEKLWICKSQQNKEIYGFIHCRQAYRRPSVADIKDVFIKKNCNQQQIISALLAHTKEFYTNLGMKRIMAYNLHIYQTSHPLDILRPLSYRQRPINKQSQSKTTLIKKKGAFFY